MYIYHCAARRNGKPSRISPQAAAWKRCRSKYGGPCKYSYMLEKGERADAGRDTDVLLGVRAP